MDNIVYEFLLLNNFNYHTTKKIKNSIVEIWKINDDNDEKYYELNIHLSDSNIKPHLMRYILVNQYIISRYKIDKIKYDEEYRVFEYFKYGSLINFIKFVIRK